MAANTVRGFRTETTADLAMVARETVESAPRVRDLPPVQEWGYEPEADAEGWLRLTGALAGAAVHTEIARIAARDLTSDPIRRVREYRVRRLVADFDPAKVGTLLVSQRPHGAGARVVIEGNHRLVAVRDRLQMSGFLFRCEVYKGLTLAQEAFLWGAEEDRLRPSPMEDLIGRVQEQQPDALAIKRALDTHGVRMRGVSDGLDDFAWPFIEAGEQLEKAYKLFGERTLEHAVGHVTRVWGRQHPILRSAYDGHALLALAYVRARYEGRIDPRRLDERLSMTTPKAIRKAGGDVRDTLKPRVPNSLAQCIASVVVGLYNTRLTSNRLAEWEWVK